MHNTNKDIIKIKDMCKKMRKNILDMAINAGVESSHFGGGLSIVEITATLYGKIMSFKLGNPRWDSRDKFVLSKGHGVLGFYSALAEVGIIEHKDLQKFEKSGGFLFGHPIMNLDKGIEISSGSLGMGLSVGIGMAIASIKKKINNRIFVLLGDGECNEGSNWEAFMSAPKYKLHNLTLIIDKNNLQQTGSNEEIMSIGNIQEKIRSFGWHTIEVDGHNIEQLLNAFSTKKKDAPVAVIANTIKGKGFSFSENNNDWHHKILSKTQYEIALKELEQV